ncbi:hypothetical protein GALMADRAFT_223731 [Galerina marginata CBS 339.88]|uniref:WSC domain-containing protein n=1 Tax=Galerina marginata (strain CBS 339.88) TaxID=685588 RepID=A0A067TI42_GALM3|nr:hypothetical protein GALMADRAFT_223731 [Galerina marginata CBS 339.88]
MAISILVLTAILSAISFPLLPRPVTAQLLDTRQSSNANGPPPGWSLAGCYTDRAGARTLKTASFVNTTGMTPSMCIKFCSDPNNFEPSNGYAGVEYEQAYCDGVVQLTANLTDPSECNLPCKGDTTLTCGGSNRISIFTNGTPSPKIPTTAISQQRSDGLLLPLWQYVGCYSDSGASRSLERLAGSVDVNLCGTICQNTFPSATTLFAGNEYGQECWCGTSVASTAQRLPDLACESMGCFGINDLACGGEFIMSLYQYLPLISTPPQACHLTTLTQPFQLQAIFYDNPSERLPITMIGLEHHRYPRGFDTFEDSTEAGILSICPTCLNSITFNLTNASLLPNLNSSTAISNLSVVRPSGTPNFVEITDSLRVFGGYCSTNSRFSTGKLALTTTFVHSAPISAPPNFVLDPTIPWALCSNGTANNRMDIVFKQFLLAPGFNLTNCRDVELQMI